MKVWVKSAALYAAAVCARTIFSFAVYTGAHPGTEDEAADTGAAAASVSYSDLSRYTVGEYNDMVAVFEAGIMDTPRHVTDIPVHTLRKQDRSALNTGIQARTFEEVLQILEDFGS